MSIVLDTKLDEGAGLPTLTDYAAALANDTRCLGVWSFERDNIVQGLGGVAWVGNLKTGGAPLIQTDSNRRPVSVYDPDLRRSVLNFSNTVAKVLTAPALTWRSDLATTMLFIVRSKLATGNADFHLIGGNVTGSDFVGLFTVNTRVGYEVSSGRIASPRASAPGREGWNRIVASITAAQEPRGQANEGTVSGAASGTANGKPTTTAFQISHDTFLFGGDLAAAVLLGVDVYSSGNDDILALAHAYLDEITGKYI